MASPLKFIPFETFVDSAFWHALAKKKLNDYRLSEGPFLINASYSNCSTSAGLPRVYVGASAFTDLGSEGFYSPSFVLRGQLTTFNNVEDFRSLDKQLFINTYGESVFKSAIKNAGFISSPEKLLTFQLITYCDFKRFKFYFWFSYPALMHASRPLLRSSKSLTDEFSSTEINDFLASYGAWRKTSDSAFFIVRAPAVVQSDRNIIVDSFARLDIRDPGMFLGFCDPSTDFCTPGWPLRNVLFALSATQVEERQSLRVLCFRQQFVDGHRCAAGSVVLDVELSPLDPSSATQYVGWEKCKNRLIPRTVDLSGTMNPVKLSESAVDLNLKLMKWRLLPDLNLDAIRNSKCLLIGAGTLGCNVARQLLAWGVRTLTFVDNSNVSLSNPVRQSLFTFNDAANGGRSKSEAAAEALSAIFPGVSAQGFQINIPMPGHPVVEYDSPVPSFDSLRLALDQDVDCTNLSRQLREAYLACRSLNKLISQNDVIFLLTDTRESRWLPTLLGKFQSKIVINAALGFDTYLVMRHGLGSYQKSEKSVSLESYRARLKTDCELYLDGRHRAVSGNDLGCYFCNDVVGPTNSVQNRSLDQQCTVTRPGVSMMASAIAVELFISLIQHPEGGRASASHSADQPEHSASASTFSLIPHQIRGFISSYSHILPATLAFKHCSACSDKVLSAFENDGFAFLLHVFNDADYLELVCGLKALHCATDENQVIALSDSDDTLS